MSTNYRVWAMTQNTQLCVTKHGLKSIQLTSLHAAQTTHTHTPPLCWPRLRGSPSAKFGIQWKFNFPSKRSLSLSQFQIGKNQFNIANSEIYSRTHSNREIWVHFIHNSTGEPRWFDHFHSTLLKLSFDLINTTKQEYNKRNIQFYDLSTTISVKLTGFTCM